MVLDLMLVDVVLLLALVEHLKLPQLAFAELSLLLTAPSPAFLGCALI